MKKLITVNGRDVEVNKKKIKNLHLKVLPGKRITVSAPMHLSDERIISFITAKEKWIEENLQRVKDNFSFINDDKIMLFGKEYEVEINFGKKSSLQVDEKAVLTVPKGADIEKTVSKLLKPLLLDVINEKLAYRVNRTGLIPSQITIRNMKTRWGTCNVKTRKICFSLQLAKKSPFCIDYVVTHELGHLINRYHDKRFYNYLTNNFPDYKKAKELLNSNY